MRSVACWILSTTLSFIYATCLMAATPGTWDGSAEFGTFEMDVTDDGMGIDYIMYTFADFSCGSLTMNGGMGFGTGTPWPIVSGSFSFTNTLSPNRTMTMTGSFTSLTQASGTWQADINGTVCNGSWTADTTAAGADTDVIINHAFIQGVYWNPLELPGWGFFADLQAENFFAAVFGYLDGQASFITLQGTPVPGQILTWRGDVTYSSDGAGGPSGIKVGEFTWAAGNDEAVPAAMVTLTSNILNVDQLFLTRFSFVEQDEVDVLTGARWNVVRRENGMSFSDYYEISDDRENQGGITYARVSDLNDPSMTGLVGYFELPEGDFYAMLVEFDSTREVFYVFLATDSDMYGRFWIVDAGAEPEGDGQHFRATSDSLLTNGSDGAASLISSRASTGTGPNKDRQETGSSLEGAGRSAEVSNGVRQAYQSLQRSLSELE